MKRCFPGSVILACLLLVSLSFGSLSFAQTQTSPSPKSSALAENLQLLTAENYVPAVEAALKKAQKSIDIVMYLIQLKKETPDNPVFRLLNSLIDAKNRGVALRVIMEGSHRTQNLAAYNYLSKNGIPVFFDTNAKFIHEKTIVIDAATVIIGSQNWSDVSLVGNLEKAVLVVSRELAQKTINEINRIEVLKKVEEAEGVRLPLDFFHSAGHSGSPARPGPGARLLTNNANNAFDLYLIILRENKNKEEGPGGPARRGGPDWEAWGKELGYDRKKLHQKNSEYYQNYYRMVVQEQLLLLDRNYHLIQYTGRQPIKILNLAAPDEPFSADRDFITIPQSYWDYGWNRRLPLRAKYAYLINLVELKRSYYLPSWFRSQEDIGQLYGIYPDTFGKGILDLARYNLVEIQGDLAAPDRPYSERLANYYTLNPLYSMEDFDLSFENLKKKYGPELVKSARVLADDLNEPCDLKVIEKFVELIQKYGLTTVRKANHQTAQLRLNNAKRNIYNTIEKLEN